MRDSGIEEYWNNGRREFGILECWKGGMLDGLVGAGENSAKL
jgi:hypothetical protein